MPKAPNFLPLFYTYLKLQGSQTLVQLQVQLIQFYTYLKLQGSQTWTEYELLACRFYTYLKLQGSQTVDALFFLPLLVLHLSEITRFSNYYAGSSYLTEVLHLSEITRFSNNMMNLTLFKNVLHLSEITRFSNSIIKYMNCLLSFTLI